MTRYSPNYLDGLTDEQVSERTAQGLTNADSPIKTKSVFRIITDNMCTLFNAINFIIALALLSVNSYRNMLFCGVVISNLAIGIFQEIRAKIATDKLSLISSCDTYVIRNGVKKKIKNDCIVLDDVLFLSRGDSVPCDCILLHGTCEVNEALVTGESDPISKSNGDVLISGSFIVSGSCYVKADKIGADHFASKITSDAKYIKKTNSQIMNALNSIIRMVTLLIFPVGILQFCGMYFLQGMDITSSVEATSAAIIGMIPEGLILLVSSVLAVSVVRLSRKNVLVQELYCIESLARVDTLCLDKTGTLTQGIMSLEDVIYISPKQEVEYVLVHFTSCAEDSNPTFDAIKQAFPPSSDLSEGEFTPFSSSRKFSSLVLENDTYYLGAGDILCPEEYKKYTSDVPKGRRILALCREDSPMCFLIIKDTVKANAKSTLEYFKKQGVDIKIISGDSAETVSAVAKELNINGYDSFIDATSLKSLDDCREAVNKYTIFGRVTPKQKEMLVKALQSEKRIVAMTGDGVNDVLALKASDLSIAMANGSSSARNVSHIILLDSDFAALPDVLYEGRRTINNIRRSASMFLVKTLFTIMLSIIYLFFDLPYPFIPIQLTLISTLTIGIPSFFLALEPSEERVKTSFLSEILKKAFPAALCVVICIICATFLHLHGTISAVELSTISTLTTGFVGLYLLYTLCIPFNRMRIILLSAMSIGFFGIAFLFAPVFEFSTFSFKVIACTLIISCCSICAFNLIQLIIKLLHSRIKKC